MWLLRSLMLLALVVWIGGIIFFAFVMAPTLFVVLPSTKLAGDVVSPALSKLHGIGLASGALFLLCSIFYNWRKYAQLRLFSATHVFVVLMLALTAVSQFGITPRMRQIRSQGNSGKADADVVQVANVNLPPKPSEFERLHAWSTRTEGAALLLGLGVVVLTARKPN